MKDRSLEATINEPACLSHKEKRSKAPSISLANFQRQQCKPRNGLSKAINLHIPSRRSGPSPQPGSVPLQSPVIPKQPSLLQQEKDERLVVDCTNYFNAHIATTAWPAQRPFVRPRVDVQSWRLLPEIMQYLWIVTVRTMQASKNGVDPSSTSDLCYYRGRSLRALHELLFDVSSTDTDPYGIALFSVLFFMGVDLQLSEAHWTSHLEAARRIISLHGGFAKSYEVFSVAHGPLITYMTTDILTATMCDSQILGSSCFQSQYEYLGLLPGLEQDLIASGYPFPQPLLQVVVQIDLLRAYAHYAPANGSEIHSSTLEPSALLESINAFSPEQWANGVSSFGRKRPERALDNMSVASLICLTSLTVCYKSATLLYLMFSIRRSRDTRTLARQGQTAHSTKHTLMQHTELLFSKASKHDHDGPLHTQLWKFVVWPLVVYTYVCAGWDIGKEPLDSSLGYLRRIAEVKGSTRLLEAEQLAHRVEKERAARPSDSAWTWDDAFGSRCAFVL